MKTEPITKPAQYPKGVDAVQAVSSMYASRCACAVQQAYLHGQASSALSSTIAPDSAESFPSTFVDFVLIQNLGLDRSNQEDAARVGHHQIFCQGRFQSFDFAVLADGCGGMAGGEVASAISCDVLSRRTCAGVDVAMSQEGGSLTRTRVKGVFEHAFRSANDEIIHTASEYPTLHGMASTGVCALVHGDIIDVAWAGDSRAELYRAGKAIHATTDHNRAQALVNAGILTPEEAAGHPGRSHLTNALGTHDDEAAIPEVTRWILVPGDLVVLSSDGFHEGISSALMAQVCAAYLTPPVGAESLRAMARVLECESLRAYGGDNLTAAFMYVRKTRSV